MQIWSYSLSPYGYQDKAQEHLGFPYKIPVWWVSCLYLFLLLCFFKNSPLCLVAKSCPTLCHPICCSSPSSSACGISQARILEWVAISFSRGSSWPLGSNLSSPHWQVGSLITESPGKPTRHPANFHSSNMHCSLLVLSLCTSWSLAGNPLPTAPTFHPSLSLAASLFLQVSLLWPPRSG